MATALAQRNDPFFEDHVRGSCASTMQDLQLPAKAVGLSGRRSGRTARQWLQDGQPLFEPSLLTYRLARLYSGAAFRIVAHFRAIAFQGMIANMQPRELVARFWVLMPDEGEAEGAANKLQNSFGGPDGCSLQELEAALQHHATELEELVAVVAEMRLRRIDPRDPKWRA